MWSNVRRCVGPERARVAPSRSQAALNGGKICAQRASYSRPIFMNSLHFDKEKAIRTASLLRWRNRVNHRHMWRQGNEFSTGNGGREENTGSKWLRPMPSRTMTCGRCTLAAPLFQQVRRAAIITFHPAPLAFNSPGLQYHVCRASRPHSHLQLLRK